MFRMNIAIAMLALMPAAICWAEDTSMTIESQGNVPPQQMSVKPQNSGSGSVTGNTAAGEQQTTIVDENGNLHVVTPSNTAGQTSTPPPSGSAMMATPPASGSAMMATPPASGSAMMATPPASGSAMMAAPPPSGSAMMATPPAPPAKAPTNTPPNSVPATN